MIGQRSNHRSRFNVWRLGLRLLLALAMATIAGPAVPARADTNVCGPITTDTIWNLAGSPYVVTCDVDVASGFTLTIQSGVVVKYNAATALVVNGTLVSTGATFTSSKSSPLKGDWKHILFTASSQDAVFDAGGNYLSGSKLQSSLVEWGGGGNGVKAAVEISGASPFLDNNTIRNNDRRGVYAQGRAGKRVELHNNTISNNQGGVYISGGRLFQNSISANRTGGDSGEDGGGVFASSSILDGNMVTNNFAPNEGGGIYASGSDLSGNTISNNTAVYGAGVFAVGGTLTNNQVLGNYGNVNNCYGAGIFASGGTISGNTVSGNSLNCYYHANGGGIHATISTISNNTVSNNSVISGNDASGGGIFSSGSSLVGNTISGNSVNAGNLDFPRTGFGGGVYANGGMVNSNTILNNNASGDKEGLGGGVYADIATLQTNTLSGNSATRGGAVYAFKGLITSNTILTNTASLSGTLYIDQGTASLNTLRANNAFAGGAIYSKSATLTGNTAQSNQANMGAGIYAINSTVRGNTLKENIAQSDGGGLWGNGGAITHNQIVQNEASSYGRGSGAYLEVVTNFSYNNVVSNTASGGTVGGVTVGSASTLQYNNLYANTPYDAEITGGQNVTGTLNYWGPAACGIIPVHIYDGNDLPGLGILSYAPSLYSPVPVAQLPSPLSLNLNGDDSAVDLSWSALPPLPNVGCHPPGYTGPDIGYRVYYGPSACPPYNGASLPQGPSPIDVGTTTSLQLTGLAAPAVYFVVTAYDYLGRLSGFSNVVVKPSNARYLYLPILKK